MLVNFGDWRSIALRGAAAIVFGLLALVWPDLTLTALVVLFGVYVLADGITALVAAVRGPARERRGPLLVEALISIGAGVVTLLWPAITALALLYVIAAWALITGIAEIAAAIRLRRELTHEWALALAGALSVGFAILLVVTPGAGALAITWAIGGYALLFGLLLVALALRLRRLTNELTVVAETRRPGSVPRPRSSVGRQGTTHA